AKNMAMSVAIASSIVALAILVTEVVLAALLGGTVAIFTVLLLIFFIVEIILFFSGIKTMSERFTELIADSIYDVDLILKNYNSPDRLNFNITDFELVNEALGMTAGNSFRLTVSITNT